MGLMHPSLATVACLAILAVGVPTALRGSPSVASTREPDPFAQLQGDAERGDVKAQYVLGCLYNGDRGHPRDPAKAAEWWSRAASGGSADAQFCFGLSRYLGEGVARDPADAVGWWKKAAGQDNADAEYFLGLSCLKGLGTDRSTEQAVYWLRRSADQGNEQAAAQLARIGTVARLN